MKFSLRALSVKLLVVSFCVAKLSFAQLTDKNVYAPPAYSAFLPPAVGSTYTEPVFGTSIKRVTGALETSNLDRGGNLVFITNEYSSMTPFNLDNSKFILIHQSYFALYNSNGAFLKALPMEIGAASEPRWSRNDPNALYYHLGNQLKKYDVSTDVRSVVHTFTEYSAISGKGESDISFDGDHMVFSGDDRFVFIYQLSTDSKGSVFDTNGRGFDSVYITPNNNVTITWLQAGTGRYNGIELFDSNMSFLRQVAHAGGHMDVTRDNGEEVLVWTNANDSAPLQNCDNGIVKIRLSDAMQTCLVSLDWNLAVHISGTDNSGYVFVETYAPSNPAPGSSGWVPYTNEILQVKLDGAEVRRLAHHRSRPFGSYNYMPRVSASRDGKQLIYSSNYNMQATQGYALDYTDVYQMNLSVAEVAPSTVPISAAVLLSTGSLPTAVQNTAYESSPTATGGTPPYTWTITAGTLPTGLSLNPSSGIIFGIPTTSGMSTFNVQVTDSTSASSSGMLSILVASPATPALVAPVASTSTIWIEQDAAAITYSGAWFPNNLPGHSANGASLAMDAGSRATITFTGTSIRWIGYRDGWSGIANVYVDGELKATVDTSASPSQYKAVLYSISDLPANTHTLIVEVAGTQGLTSAGAWIWIDSFDVDNTTSGGGSLPTSSRVEQDNANASYTGAWFNKNHPGLSGGTAKLAMDSGSAVTFSFSGTNVSWIGYKDAWSGIAKVSVDGTSVGQIDTYSPTDHTQTALYTITGLSPGNHALNIEALQRKNASSGGSWIWVDGFEVQP
jgi:hypothetical protein